MKYITLKVNYDIVNNRNEIKSSHEITLHDTTRETAIYVLSEKLSKSVSCINITSMIEL